MNDLIASVEQMGNVLNNVLGAWPLCRPPPIAPACALTGRGPRVLGRSQQAGGGKAGAGHSPLQAQPRRQCGQLPVPSHCARPRNRPPRGGARRLSLRRGPRHRPHPLRPAPQVDEALAASALDYPFYTDTYRLLQCCSNLMSNACKFTQAGSVTLRIVLVDVVLGNKGAAGHTGASPAVGGLRKRCCGTGGSGYGATSDPATEQGCPSVCQEGEEDVASRLSAAMDQAEGGGGASGVEGDEGQAAREWGHARTAFAPYCVVRFEVRDTGPGLSKADQRKLFVSYSQCHASVARAHGGPCPISPAVPRTLDRQRFSPPAPRPIPGTGLGLTIVKELARLTGGHVGVRSRLGCGSAFFFTTRLYLRKPSAQVLEALQREATDAAREEAHRVESSQVGRAQGRGCSMCRGPCVAASTAAGAGGGAATLAPDPPC